MKAEATMRVDCTVKENFIIPQLAELGGDMMSKVAEHFAWLAAQERNHFLKLYELSVTVDGETRSCRLADLAALLLKADSLRYTADYQYGQRSYSDIPDGNPQNLAEYIAAHGESLGAAAFYSMYVLEDGATDAGQLFAYGHLKGKTYQGKVEPHLVKELPESGRWTSPLTTVSYETDNTAGLELDKIRQVCAELSTMSEDDTVQIEEDHIQFLLNNITLRGAADFQRAIQLLDDLTELSDGECGYDFRFVDEDDPFGRMLEVNWDADGVCRLFMAFI